MFINHAEAQELHYCIGASMPGSGVTIQEQSEYLRRALEIAALVVCDTDSDTPTED